MEHKNVGKAWVIATSVKIHLNLGQMRLFGIPACGSTFCPVFPSNDSDLYWTVVPSYGDGLAQDSHPLP
jgi:hypothetical protein